MMNIQWKFVSGLGALGVVCGLAVAALPHAARANVFFQKQTGQSCASCHLPGQEEKGVQGLNDGGHAFKNCGYKVGCNAAATPAAKTTETNTGIVTFSNNQCGGQIRWVVLRPGSNDRARDMALILDPGQRIKVAVSQGSSWLSKCGDAPSHDQQFHWIPLQEAIQ